MHVVTLLMGQNFLELTVLLVKIARRQYVKLVPIGQDDFYFLRRFCVKHVQIKYQNQKNW